ncbi:uncharacterized protein LDX57_012526 [Aspergillus melleus]|uniref:uncharacterized protein n=1 Tax=Aspergillus melleus TaxID=138277 RepID=UPI001E8CF0FB|nr:uncharacterized protein LDX57_012526 [Aspergillus melleus]KAH8434895.1 hypothetical protein LDX57_012526 [Aspergillus melleus]
MADKSPDINTAPAAVDLTDDIPMKPPQEAQEQQDGVRVAEAVTSSWSKNSLIAV